jgi:ABC-type multidrug transport system fused ATPase/permease subunit
MCVAFAERAAPREIALIPQDPFLFSATIRENIAFGRPTASEEEIIAAAKLAGIYDEILEFPNGLDTIVRRARRQLIGRAEAARGDGTRALAQPQNFDLR